METRRHYVTRKRSACLREGSASVVVGAKRY